MIVYKNLNCKNKVNILVYLDGKPIGNIKTYETGYSYFPKGSKEHGEVFRSIEKVQKSLEE